eukprot:scaffold62211_cov58-Phaeocystis_antarctica.AAC.2
MPPAFLFTCLLTHLPTYVRSRTRPTAAKPGSPPATSARAPSTSVRSRGSPRAPRSVWSCRRAARQATVSIRRKPSGRPSRARPRGSARLRCARRRKAPGSARARSSPSSSASLPSSSWSAAASTSPSTASRRRRPVACTTRARLGTEQCVRTTRRAPWSTTGAQLVAVFRKSTEVIGEVPFVITGQISPSLPTSPPPSYPPPTHPINTRAHTYKTPHASESPGAALGSGPPTGPRWACAASAISTRPPSPCTHSRSAGMEAEVRRPCSVGSGGVLAAGVMAAGLAPANEPVLRANSSELEVRSWRVDPAGGCRTPVDGFQDGLARGGGAPLDARSGEREQHPRG